jgi:hypothetical protein
VSLQRASASRFSTFQVNRLDRPREARVAWPGLRGIPEQGPLKSLKRLAVSRPYFLLTKSLGSFCKSRSGRLRRVGGSLRRKSSVIGRGGGSNRTPAESALTRPAEIVARISEVVFIADGCNAAQRPPLYIFRTTQASPNMDEGFMRFCLIGQVTIVYYFTRGILCLPLIDAFSRNDSGVVFTETTATGDHVNTAIIRPDPHGIVD